MGPNAPIRLMRDRFVAGHENCALRRHLDSVPPKTPIRDIVDRYRVWESHVDTGARIIVKPAPEMTLPIYTVDEPACMLADRVVAAATAPAVGARDLEALLRRLLPTAPIQTPPLHPIPTEMEILLKHLLSGAPAPAPAPAPTPQTGIAGMETLLQRLLPGTPVPASQS